MKSEMDNREWLNAYSTLKQVDPRNPFTVPAGYFDELEQRITSHVHLLEIQPDSEGFIVPENYFNELSNNIQSRLAIEEVGSDTGFTVPDNYFNELSSNIQSRVAIEEISGSEAGFAVPENYFDSLSQQISARITVEEALEQRPFAVPVDYFDKLSQNILSKTTGAEQAKPKRDGAVVRKLFATTAFRYAAAACFAVVIGATVLLNQSGDVVDHNSSFLHKQISSLPASDIQTYLQDDVDANDTQHAVVDENTQVNDSDLDKALKSLDETTRQ